jgi:hypothetical protein
LEVGDTAGLETCATMAGDRCLEKSSQLVTMLRNSTAKDAEERRECKRFYPPIGAIFSIHSMLDVRCLSLHSHRGSVSRLQPVCSRFPPSPSFGAASKVQGSSPLPFLVLVLVFDFPPSFDVRCLPFRSFSLSFDLPTVARRAKVEASQRRMGSMFSSSEHRFDPRRRTGFPAAECQGIP